MIPSADKADLSFLVFIPDTPTRKVSKNPTLLLGSFRGRDVGFSSTITLVDVSNVGSMNKLFDGDFLFIRLTKLRENTIPSISVTVNENIPIPNNAAVILEKILDKIILNLGRRIAFYLSVFQCHFSGRNICHL